MDLITLALAKSSADGIKEKFGSPLVASTVSDMVEQNRVYVYTGSETGYTNGNWYYYDGNNWISGGVYNSVAVDTDDTLSVADKAADAKAVGDEISALKDDLLQITEWNNQVESTLAANETKRFYIYAQAGDIVTITSSVVDPEGGIRCAVYYKDGTNTGSTILNEILRFRAEKDITYISIYSNAVTTITITKSKNPLSLTNYYNKETKQSGFIQDGTQYNGYYHSDYIPCTLGDTLIYNGYPSTFGTVRVYFYDSNHNYIGRKGGTLREDGLYETKIDFTSIANPFLKGNVYYCVFNMTVDGSDTAVFYINSIPDTNIEYGQYQPNSNEFFNAQQKEYISSSGSLAISGKKIAYNGDSICESRIASGNIYNGGAYPKMIADLTSGTYENRAHGGAILASAVPDGTLPHCIVSDIANMTNDADLICFEGGINDYWRHVPLGDYSESDYSSTLDTTTICGALESIFRQAKQKWVGKPICFVITHKIKSTVYVANSAGYNWMQVHEKIVGICKKYAIPYYDAFDKSGLNAYDDIQNTTFLTSNSSGTADGCHPNAMGYEKYYVPQLIALFNSIMPRS